MTDRIILKNHAKQRISEKAPLPYTVTLVYLVIDWTIYLLITKLNEPISIWARNAGEYIYNLGQMPGVDSIIYPSYLFILVLDILMQVITVGYMSYSLGIARGSTVSFSNLGDGFYRFWKLVAIFILTGIFTFLWSLLLIVPGIVALYRYRLAYYIALDHPEFGPLECINESKRLMNGNKFDLFVLDLSFLGWYLLGNLTFKILMIWKLPYIEVTYAYFYLELAYPSVSYNNPQDDMDPPNI